MDKFEKNPYPTISIHAVPHVLSQCINFTKMVKKYQGSKRGPVIGKQPEPDFSWTCWFPEMLENV